MEESKDCLKCRLTSGGGLIAGGAYVVHQSKKVKTFSRHIITLIGCGLGVLGILRIFALPPFQIKSEVHKGNGENEGKENEISPVLKPRLRGFELYVACNKDARKGCESWMSFFFKDMEFYNSEFGSVTCKPIKVLRLVH